MKLQVQSYDETAGLSGVYNAEAEETNFRTYTIDHEFNKPAKAIITIADTDGSMMRKYNGDTTAVFMGIGKATIEDPDGTDVFYGRIMKATSNSASKTVTLECDDWLSQLDEELITYDMREDLDSDGDMGEQGIRQSYLHADPDNATIVDVALNDAGTYYLYDDNRSWNADEFNGMSLFLTAGMAGKKIWTFHPYQATVSDGVTGDGDPDDIWVDDETVAVMFKNADWTVDYDFRVYLGNDLPSDFYVHSSISGMRVVCVHMVTVVPSTNHAHVQILENDGPSYLDLEHLDEIDTLRQSTHEVDLTNLPNIVDNNGIVQVRYDVDRVGGNATLTLRYLALEVETETTGYSTAVTINDTLDLNGDGGKVNCLEVATDMTAAATRVWERVPYCIAKPIYKHLDTAETVGLSLISDEGGDLSRGGPDPIVGLTAAATVEHTAGISTRQYKDNTRLFILRDLAHQDKAMFWITLGGTTVTWKKTFGADTQQLTDGDVLEWGSLYDYNQLVNKYLVYGIRIGDYEIYQTASNAASIGKYEATRSKAMRSSGAVTDYEAKALATTLAARDAELSQMVSCVIAGNTATAGHATTIKLGEIVEITSSYLWSTASKDYIVTRFTYDSAAHKTYLTMHPKASIGLQEIDTPHTQGQKAEARLNTLERDKYVPDPISHEVS